MLGKELATWAIAVLALTALVGAGAVSASAEPGLQGPSPEQKAEQGWVCGPTPIPWVGVRCYNPGEGHPPIPPLGEDGRPSYTTMDWGRDGDFLGHAHLIRADLYNGQPCAQRGGGPYTFAALLGYYQCFRYA